MRSVFLISLPRSGSTLLQKMLAVSPRVATVAEPWICLPLAAMMEPGAIVAKYWHGTCELALQDLVRELPGGEAEFRTLCADLVRNIYERIGGGAGRTVFIDKTPRYYMIIPFLAEAFPDARFVFLFRNPVEVLASILKTWHKDRFGPSLLGSWVDIVRGPEDMVRGAQLLGDRAMVVQYAQLVAQPAGVVADVCRYLDIPFSDEMLTRYQQVEFSGRMGDQVGVRAYRSVSTQSLSKWKAFVRNRYRKRFVKQYLRRMGPEVLSGFGLDMDGMLAELDTLATGFAGSIGDVVGMCRLRRALRQDARHVGHQRNRGHQRRPLVPYG